MKCPVAGVLLLLLLALQLQPCLGAIHEYADVVLPKDTLMYRRSGMFASSAKRGESFIKVDLKLTRSADAPPLADLDGEKLKIQLAVFDESVWEHGLGVYVKNPQTGESEHVFCCTQELVRDKVCDEPYTLILSEDAQKGTYVHTVDMNSQAGTPLRIDRHFPVTSKGLKYLLIASCNDMTGDVTLRGRTEWRNPHGYLPGELRGFLRFTLALAIVYVVLGLVWAAASMWRWRELMILQTYVTAVLGLSMMEMTFRYHDYAQFNAHGTRSTGLMLWASVLHTSKQTVSRLLVLVVSMGFGIVKPSLGDQATSVWAMGGLFFFFAMVQRVYELSAHTSAVTFMQYVTMLPVAALDLVFFVWIFRSLSEIVLQLESKTSAGQDNAKLGLYLKFRRVLWATLAVAALWATVYSYIVVSGKISKEWETRWVFDGFFDLEYLAVLVAIMVLWRPTNNGMQFAYAKVPTQRQQEEDEEEYGQGLEEEAKKIVAAVVADTAAAVLPEKPNKD